MVSDTSWLHAAILLALLSAWPSKPAGSSDASATDNDQSNNTSTSEPHGPDDGLGLRCSENHGVPNTPIEYRDWGFDRYTDLLTPNAKAIRTLHLPHHSIHHV
jgi:hypothetical protein